MNRLITEIEQNLRSYQFVGRDQRIVVAVSGGLDSMVLLHILHRLSRKTGWKLGVAHLNHQLRGRNSDADERLVRRTGKSLRLEVTVGREPVREFARENKISLEMAARKLRHDFLARAARQMEARYIALAHHANDQVELFFLRLFRGAGGEGLSGMKWLSASPSDRSIKLIRPLLNVTKADLKAYAAENKIAFREDATNASLDIQRNRIRQELLPLLERKYQPRLGRTVARVMETVGAEAHLTTRLATDWLQAEQKARWKSKHASANPKAFEDLPVAVQRRCLQLQLFRHGIEGEFDLIERLRTHPNTRISIGKVDKNKSRGVRPGLAPELKIKTAVPLWVSRDPEGLVFFQTAKSLAFNNEIEELELGRQGKARFGGVQLSWKIVREKGNHLLKRRRGGEVFDADKVGSPITLRHWLPGDRFQPIGMNSSVKLQDIFTNERVPSSHRRQLILGVTKKRQIFWVEGLRISERFKLTKSTNRRLLWRW